MWALRGSRPRAVRQTQYDYLWLAGAVCPQTGESCGLLLPHLNAETLTVFLEQLSAQLATDVLAVVIWDGAAFHRSQHLLVPHNIRLWQLPSYSPELNPIENLWHYLKSHYWSNRFYDDYLALLDAAQFAWQQVSKKPEIMMSVCAASYIS